MLLVHRPKYDDWSFPKGKLDRGEHATAAAVREVEEETGLRVRLGVPLHRQRYPVRAGTKPVHYWVGRAVGDGDVSGYEPNAEIDEVAWFPIDKARRRLTYDFDVRHAGGGPGAGAARPAPWSCSGTARRGRARRGAPTTGRGRCWRPAGTRPRRLVPVLAAYDVGGSSPPPAPAASQTLAPYAEATGRRLRTDAPAERGGRQPQGACAPCWSGLLEGLAERPASAGGWSSAPTGRCCPSSSTPSGMRGSRARRPASWSCCTCARAGSWRPSGTASAEQHSPRPSARRRSRDASSHARSAP